MKLKPGIYVLTREVDNPKADGRIRSDWRYRKVIPLHARFLVREIDGEWKEQAPLEIVPVGDLGRFIYKSRRGSGKYDALWDVLVPWLESAEANVTEQFMDLGLNHSNAKFLAELVVHGLPFEEAAEAVKHRAKTP